MDRRAWRLVVAILELMHWAANCAADGAASRGGGRSGPGLDLTLLVRTQNTETDREQMEGLTMKLPEENTVPGLRLKVLSMADATKELRHTGLWTFKPWIHHLAQDLSEETRKKGGASRWFLFLEPSSGVDIMRLMEVLHEYSAKGPHFLGFSLTDKESSIVHHYSLDTNYPLLHAGFALNSALVKKLASDLVKNPLSSNQQIEPVWELAKWCKTVDVLLTNRPDAFCKIAAAGCAVWATPRWQRPLAMHGLEASQAVIAVKTVENFHSTRLQLMHEVWASASPVEVLFLSNSSGSAAGLPKDSLIDLSPEFGDKVDPAKESTAQGSGHCSKMEAILAWLRKYRAGRRWYIVADDDTLFNVPELLRILDSHDDSKAIYIGERYGWAHMEANAGTNYLTTGAGMALSAPALAALQDCRHCICRTPNAPDDMTLGSWFRSLPSVEVVHDDAFHQAEPHNYHEELLRMTAPSVSFHRYNFRERVPDEVAWKRKKENWFKWSQDLFKIPPSADTSSKAEL